MEPDRYEYEPQVLESMPVADERPALPPDTTPETVRAPGALDGVGPALRELAETILLTLVIFFMIRFAVENFRIEGYSMEPNFHDGQFLLVNKLAYKIGHPTRNDVIIFHFPLNEEKNYIKRVIGLPGDSVQVIDGKVFINGISIPEPYPHEHADYNYGSTVVPPGQYFVLGDNRPESSDSHFWGFVPAKDIVGKAWVSYWPPQLWGIVPDYSPANASP